MQPIEMKYYLQIQSIYTRSSAKRSPPEIPNLKRAHQAIRRKREGEAQLKADIPAKRSTRMSGNRANPPRLTHTRHHTGNTKPERQRRRNAQGQLVALIVVLGAIAAEAAAEDEVICDSDAGVDGQPVGDQVHEVLEDDLEVAVARDGDGEGHAGGEEGPDEAGHALRPAAQDLKGEGDRVYVRAVVGDDGEGKDHEAEFAEAAEGLEDCAEEAAVARRLVPVEVLVVLAIQRRRGVDGDAQELGEEQWDDQAEPGRQEDQAAAAVCGLVHGVIGGVARPARRETVHCRTEG